MGYLAKIFIFLFVTFFTVLSLAEEPKSRKDLLTPEALRVDLTIKRQKALAKPAVKFAKGVARKRLIDWVKLPWVDIGDWYGKNKITDGDGEGKDGDGTGTGTGMGELGSGSGSGSGAGGGSGSGGGKGVGFGYDENAKKALAKDTPKNEGDHDHGAPPPGTPPGGGGGPIPPDNQTKSWAAWWPVCIFIPPNVRNGNEIVKTLVDMSAKCQVNIVPFAISIPALTNPDDPNEINALSTKMCNMNVPLGKPDISSMVASPSSVAADKMCGSFFKAGPNGTTVPHTDVAGCAQVRAGGMTKKQRDARGPSGGENNPQGAPGVQTSIIDAEGLNGAVAAHEAIGHSQMGWPNGMTAGNGIDDPNDIPGGAHVHGGGWTDKGCGQMRNMAYQDNNNRFKYNPTQQQYFVYQPPDRQHPLGEPLYRKEPPSLPPPQGNPPPPPPQIVRGDPPPSQLDGNFGNTPPGESARPKDPPPGSGHKKPPAGSATPVVSIRDGSAGQSSQGGVTSGVSDKGFGYDDTAKKALSDGTATNPTNPSGGATPGGDKSFGYNEGNSKTLADGSSTKTTGGTGADGGAGGSGADGTGDGANGAGAGKDGASASGTIGGRGPASIATDVKAGSSILEDEFFKRLKWGREEAAKQRGTSLRRSGDAKKPVYQGGAPADASVSSPNSRSSAY